MTDQPRLTDAARAAIEAAGSDPYYQVATLAAPTPEQASYLLGQARPAPSDTRMSDEYRRGWNDCRTLILKILGEPR